MSETGRSRLTPAEAQQKADECRELAKRALNPEHRVMLNHMAETWERIATDMKRSDGGSQ
jgi:hypothetical protein